MNVTLKNRLGFVLLGLTNNFAYVIMLSAAYDLLKQSEAIVTNGAIDPNAATASLGNATVEKYCNEHSTSTILLADTIPSLTTKLLYPFLLVGLPVAYKAAATAALSAASFLITGLSTSQLLIFAGVACASFSSGLGESTYLSNTPLYGDVALSGWSMGTGAAGLLGAGAYAILSMVLSIKIIMILMLVVPLLMMAAYFWLIEPVDSAYMRKIASGETSCRSEDAEGAVTSLSVISSRNDEDEEANSSRPIEGDLAKARNYGANGTSPVVQEQSPATAGARNQLIVNSNNSNNNSNNQDDSVGAVDFDWRAKLHFMPSLAKYFLPLLLVYFAEYFINQGLFELIYYPQVSFLSHQAQYRWFQVTYQLGVMLSRSSLDLFRIGRLWTMALLQAVNALLFLAHAAKLIHIPSFYLVLALIVYEGLLGGFTYSNTFYRMKKELAPAKHEFGVSTVTIADTLGIVFAGIAALPVHNELCKLYQ